MTNEDFNPRSPRGERPLSTPICAWSPHISIHAPREGSDQGGIQQCRAESQFQSTLPARGATGAVRYASATTEYFNPRSPRGERLPNSRRCIGDSRFQSTLPARGATLYIALSPTIQPQFQSTLPARGATAACLLFATVAVNFNPRSPRGERLTDTRLTASLTLFQSTLPARGATFLLSL